MILAARFVRNLLNQLFCLRNSVNQIGNPRTAVILGLSAFMRPEVFEVMPSTHIAGVRIRNADAVQQTVLDGSGKMIQK